MPSILFDFDSTLIRCESLEQILAADTEEKLEALHALTDQGMSGQIPFFQSLEQRLALFPPTLSQVKAFADKAHFFLTPSMGSLISRLLEQGFDLWIVSGGLQEAIEPLGLRLGFSPDRIHGVKLLWDSDGKFLAVNPEDPLSHSKVRAMKALGKHLLEPALGVGDGMTDFALYEKGYVKHFIAYTEHVSRPAVMEVTPMMADSCMALESQIKELFGESPFPS